MQRIVQAVRSCQEVVKAAKLQHSHGREATNIGKIFSRFGWMTPSSSVQEKGLENVTVAEILMAKGGESTGPWLWCNSNDAVSDAAKNVRLNDFDHCHISSNLGTTLGAPEVLNTTHSLEVSSIDRTDLLLVVRCLKLVVTPSIFLGL